MIPKEMKDKLTKQIALSEGPREQVVNVMYELQKYYGYLSDDAVAEACDLLDMTPLEIDELATFYDFIYREPVGKYVIHVCNSTICWMNGYDSLMGYLSAKLGIAAGETTSDGLFSLLPACCIGYCDHAPAILINGKPYGDLTPDTIDSILETLRSQAPDPEGIK